MRMPLSRRSLLGTSAAGVAAATVGGFAGLSAEAPALGPRRGRAPKNVVFLVVDGMAAQVMTMHDHLSQMTTGRRSYWSELLDREGVHRGWQDTRSLSSIVTDSSAASSAWGSGRRIFNAQVNVYPDGTELTPITHRMAAKGVRCGLVTTATITHATPAGFAVSCPDRDLEGLIAEKYLSAGVDVLLGGGNKFFAADKRKDGKDLYAEYRKTGFEVVQSRDALLASKARKVLGVFSESHVPYTVDRDNDPALQASTPTLAEMARHALENLKRSKEGFLLQIEGARVDHAGHSNDIAAMLNDQRAFEDAVRVAVEFAERDRETLVIVTADHACGGVSLNGAGFEYADATPGLLSVARMKSSYGPILAQLGAKPTAGAVQDAVRARLSVELKVAEAQAIADAIGGNSPFALSPFYASPLSVMGLMIGNTTKVGFTSLNHNNDHVMVTALGPWADRIEGLQWNTSFHTLLCEAKGVDPANPKMSYEDAMRAAKKGASVPSEEIYALYGSGDDECPEHSLRGQRG